jgi:hypothetical protein
MVQRFLGCGGGVDSDIGWKTGAKIVKIGLAFRGRGADIYRNFSQLRLGDPKGLPSFFAQIDPANLPKPAINAADSVRRICG